MWVAASNTSRQSEHLCRCSEISSSTLGDNLCSKYQQIKWIVSRQLIFPVFLNAVDVACTVTFSSALRTPHFLRISQARNAVNFMHLAKVRKKMGKCLGEYLRTGWLPHVADLRILHSAQERLGTMVNSRSAAIRSASGGCVLNSEDKVPPPNHGFTIQSAAVDGDTLVVGMRWL